MMRTSALSLKRNSFICQVNRLSWIVLITASVFSMPAFAGDSDLELANKFATAYRVQVYESFRSDRNQYNPVSYTHLTLPTMYSV